MLAYPAKILIELNSSFANSAPIYYSIKVINSEREQMDNTEHLGIRTWIEVDKKALKNNYITFRNLIGKKCKLMAVAKSNAYGHGLIDYSKEMEKLGADFIGVDSMTEAIALRREGVRTPILVLGYTLPELYCHAVENNISVTISSLEQLGILKRVQDDMNNTQNSVINIHIKIDTGMYRQGFYLSELKSTIEQIKKCKNIKVEGVYTHFASAKNPAFPADTKNQIAEFEKACKLFHVAKMNPIRHAAATGGAIVFLEAHFDMVRIGIGLYGLWPSKEVKSCYQDTMPLQPALSWRSIVSEIKKVKKGERIGYDFTETFREDSIIAIVPIGYWHGLPRNLSSIGHILINGQRSKILGRISMDMISIDITNITGVKIGDVVTLIGKDGKEEITAQELAYLSDTSWYETITTLNPLIRRIYI